MTVNWSSRRVVGFFFSFSFWVFGGGGLFTPMTASNDDNDICIVNAPTSTTATTTTSSSSSSSRLVGRLSVVQRRSYYFARRVKLTARMESFLRCFIYLHFSEWNNQTQRGSANRGGREAAICLLLYLPLFFTKAISSKQFFLRDSKVIR